MIDELIGQKFTSCMAQEGLGNGLLFTGGNEFTGLYFSLIHVFHKGEKFIVTNPKDHGKNKILDKEIVNAVLKIDGTLEVYLSDEIKLVFPFSGNVEAWELRLIERYIFSLPGGGWSGSSTKKPNRSKI
ncbi:MAG: hypothetical protein V4736_07510 [Bdellovibrionota bacterium]